MKGKFTLILVLGSLLGMGVAFGQSTFFTAEDYAAPFLIKYTGPNTAKVGVNVDATDLTLIDGDDTTTLDISNASYDTIAEVIGAINANTNNTDEARYWQAVKWAALDADSANATFIISTTNTLLGGIWESPVLWDTSAHLSYDVVPDGMSATRPQGSYTINGAHGDAAGTGTYVLYVYSDETLMHQRTFTQTYSLPATENYTQWTNNIVKTNTLVTIGLEDANFPLIRIQPGKRGLVRVTRGTTATGGGIGATTVPR